MAMRYACVAAGVFFISTNSCPISVHALKKFLKQCPRNERSEQPHHKASPNQDQNQTQHWDKGPKGHEPIHCQGTPEVQYSFFVLASEGVVVACSTPPHIGLAQRHSAQNVGGGADTPMIQQVSGRYLFNLIAR